MHLLSTGYELVALPDRLLHDYARNGVLTSQLVSREFNTCGPWRYPPFLRSPPNRVGMGAVAFDLC